jgi:hypothetical protein
MGKDFSVLPILTLFLLGVMQDYYSKHRLGLPPASETTTEMANQQLLNLSFVGYEKKKKSSALHS